MVKVKVPATTANLGAGYDTLGMALSLYQEVSIVPKENFIKNIKWNQTDSLSNDDNLVYFALEKTLAQYDKKHLGYSLVMEKSSIPISRGLGSSAAAIVAGIMCANVLMDYTMSQDEIIQVACKIEGHPDNVIPAIIGSLTISYSEASAVKFSKVVFPKDLALYAFVPNFKTSTESARKVLPLSYPPQDCVYNLSRVGLLIHSLYSGEYNVLKAALDDKLHQPYRMEMIKNGHDLIQAIESTDALGTFISGSGPTLMSIINIDNSSAFESQMQSVISALSNDWHMIPVNVDAIGAHYEA
jgi:homoserine kinase